MWVGWAFVVDWGQEDVGWLGFRSRLGTVHTRWVAAVVLKS